MTTSELLKPNIIVSIAGRPKSGKTHFSLTMPEPIILFSFDIGADFVAQKFKDKKVDVIDYPLPIVDSNRPSPQAKEHWEQIRDEIYKAYEGGKYNTIVIDTATALWEIIRHGYQQEVDAKSLMTYQYAIPNTRMASVIMRAHVSGVNLVLTHYLRERYVNDVPTGEMEVDGFKRTGGLVDLTILMEHIQRAPTSEEKKVRGVSKVNVIHSTIESCRFDLDLYGFEMENMGYPDLMALLGL